MNNLNVFDLKIALKATLMAHYRAVKSRQMQGFGNDDKRNQGYWEGRLAMVQSLAMDLLDTQLKDA